MGSPFGVAAVSNALASDTLIPQRPGRFWDFAELRRPSQVKMYKPCSAAWQNRTSPWTIVISGSCLPGQTA
jgi:hypothetical protein